MDRTACVDVPALPLQLLLRRNPAWTGAPVAVVAEDRPQGLVLFVERLARGAGVRTGMRHAAALSLAPDLRAGVVPGEETAAGVATIVERLLRFTPGVEPSADEPGVFFLDASGLERLHGSLAQWANALRRDLDAAGFKSRISVGFTRFGVYATARTARGIVVFSTRDEETRATRDVPLERLGIAPALRDALAKLDVRTVADFLRLPEEGLLRRFGEEAWRLRRFAAADEPASFARVVPAEPLEERVFLEHPETDATRILFLAKWLLAPLVAKAAARGEAIVEIALRLVLERHPPIEERLRPAAPTLETAQILDLLHLRLAALRPASSVIEATLSATAASATKEQLDLFAERPRRDPAAARRAFARLRAEHGEDAVVAARLADGHLPEDAFAWDAIDRAPPPRPRIAADPPLIRRILARPVAIDDAAFTRIAGPYVFAGAWWTGCEVRREFAFVETSRGGLLWTFVDPRALRFSQGLTE